MTAEKRHLNYAAVCQWHTHLCIVELCLHIQWLQNLIENGLQTECCSFLTLCIHFIQKNNSLIKIQTERNLTKATGLTKYVSLKLHHKLQNNKPKGRTVIAFALVDLWHFSVLLQAHMWAHQCCLMTLLNHNPPGIWRTSWNRASLHTEWCNWLHKLSWKSEERKQAV